jgi:hypothetical protein
MWIAYRIGGWLADHAYAISLRNTKRLALASVNKSNRAQRALSNPGPLCERDTMASALLRKVAFMHLADEAYTNGDTNPVGEGCRIVKNGAGDYTATLDFPAPHPGHAIYVISFNEDTTQGNINVSVTNVSDTVKRVRIRQGPLGTLVDIHTDIAVCMYD